MVEGLLKRNQGERGSLGSPWQAGASSSPEPGPLSCPDLDIRLAHNGVPTVLLKTSKAFHSD